MKITNKFNLPEAIVKAAQPYEKHFVPNRLSVSTLINSPYVYKLTELHYGEIEEDASDRLWALLGSAVHGVLEDFKPEQALGEEFIDVVVDGFKIAGKFDLYHEERVEDYKVTSVWSFLLGDKKVWENQLNVYAYLVRKNGFNVKELVINAILRDWQRRRAKYDPSYPRIPFVHKQIPLWTMQEQEDYIKGRIALFRDPDPAPCTDEERWARGGEYAVMKKNRKSAVKLCKTEEEAQDRISKITKDQGLYSIVKRPVEYIKCEDYCPVSKFCPYFQKIKEAQNGKG